MEIRLSVIIPFYNVQQYIAECLDSVYNQDIPEKEYEVICVNDASPDNSRDIVLQYQKKHSNLILVEHEVNKKLGTARNTGRIVAQGKYIWNVDSDDIIMSNCFGEILNRCEQNDLDVLLFENQRIRNNEIEIQKDNVLWKEEIGCGFDFWKKQGLKNQSYISPVWKMVVRRAYLDKMNIFSPTINMNEDVPYTYKCILLSNRIMPVNSVYYIYRISSNSLTNEFKKHISVEMLYEDMCMSCKDLFNLMHIISRKERMISQSIRNVIRYEFVHDFEYLQYYSDEQIRQFARKLRKNIGQIYYLFYVLSFKQKLMLLKLLKS